MKDPAFLFYPNDYIGGTMGMNFEEKGAYIELLMLQFNRGHMTEHMIGQTIGQLWNSIQDKFIKDDKGLFYNERLELEKNKRQNYTESRKNNKLGNNQYTNQSTKDRGHMTEHMEDENEDRDKDVIETVNKNEKEISNILEFWNSLADRLKITKLRSLTKSRLVKYRKRVKEGLMIEDLESAIKEQPFLTGDNDRGWMVSFDWLVANDTNWVKVIEGKYIKTNGNSGFNNTNAMSEIGQQTYKNAMNAIGDKDEEE